MAGATLMVLAFSFTFTASDQAVPIQRAKPTSLPDDIGAPAMAHPMANFWVRQRAFVAFNPFPHDHEDSEMNETAEIAGPLGRNPVALSKTLPNMRLHSWLAPCGNTMRRPSDPVLPNMVLMDRHALDALTHQPLEVKKAPVGDSDAEEGRIGT